MRYWDYYPPASPRPKAKEGKSRKKFGLTWWGKKWVNLLSKYESGQRMSRGRAYARADMVENFSFNNNEIEAKVKGSSGYYDVVVYFDKFSDEEWKIIIDKLGSIPIIISKLINNEMPENIEEIIGYNFIPESFKAKCSCPDYANPCKHIAAVFYTIADEIDYDPFILFKLRGMDKDILLKNLNLIDEEDSSKIIVNQKETKDVAKLKKDDKKTKKTTTKQLKKDVKKTKKATTKKLKKDDKKTKKATTKK